MRFALFILLACPGCLLGQSAAPVMTKAAPPAAVAPAVPQPAPAPVLPPAVGSGDEQNSANGAALAIAKAVAALQVTMEAQMKSFSTEVRAASGRDSTNIVNSQLFPVVSVIGLLLVVAYLGRVIASGFERQATATDKGFDRLDRATERNTAAVCEVRDRLPSVCRSGAGDHPSPPWTGWAGGNGQDSADQLAAVARVPMGRGH